MSQHELDAKLLELKRQKLEQLQKEIYLQKHLPHLYALKFYPWARRVFDSREREILLCSANQVGKSTIAIRRNIEWATNKELWPKLWPKLGAFQVPNLFWYFYPNFGLATTEFETKWEPLLPQGEFRSHPQYGWKATFDKGLIQKIKFNSGVTIQFKAYSQKLIDLQASSVYSITADEEMPVHILPEIAARTNATDGYFMMVFTATLGQTYWKEAMEPSSQETETHRNAVKIQVSLYDSQKFDDGTPSHWTNEKIERAKANCPTDAEVQRRIYGRFVRSEGLLYDSFSIEKNMCEPTKIPEDWAIYGAVDPGTGGTSGHPTGMVFLAVNPTYTKARVFRAWRGDNISTDSQAILNKFRELRKGLTMTMQIYDYAGADFYIVASGQGENFIRADKSREAGVAIVNTLFKNQMLLIDKDDSELQKLVTELTTLTAQKDKRKAKDDLIDPLRYICKMIPWDFSKIELPEALKEVARPVKEKTDGEIRRDWFFNKEAKDSEAWNVEQELDTFNDLLGTGSDYD